MLLSFTLLIELFGHSNVFEQVQDCVRVTEKFAHVASVSSDGLHKCSLSGRMGRAMEQEVVDRFILPQTAGADRCVRFADPVYVSIECDVTGVQV